MLRPSPNELARLKNEEVAKRRLIRLKEVREYSKSNAYKLRILYKEQKARVINKIAQTIQEEFNNDTKNKLDELKLKHAYQLSILGQGHINASDWVDPSMAQKEQLNLNLESATERHNIAIRNLRDERREQKSLELSKLRALQSALLIEKERAAQVAALPPPAVPLYLQASVMNSEDMPRVRVCDRNKFSVIESFENASYNVEKSTDPENAKEAGERRQHELLQLSSHLIIQNEEQTIKANLRGNMAFKKQVVHKHYDELVNDLEMLAKSEMAEKHRNYHTSDGFGTNMSTGGINEAMLTYKERCRERAVEGAVMESLKDITNEGSRQSQDISGHNDTVLTRLYNQIRRQKENVPIVLAKEIHNIASSVSSSATSKLAADSGHEEMVLKQQQQDKPVQNNREDVINHAISVANKAETVLSMALDARGTQAHERFPMTTNTTTTSSLDVADNIDRHNRIDYYGVQSPTVLQQHIQELSIEARKSQESLDTNHSESVSRIREFQRTALLKLNGQLNVSDIRRLERHFSNFSIYSSTLTNQSTSKSIAGKKYKMIESNSNTSDEDSKSHVKEWINSQITQGLEQLPDWVTRPDAQFIPDLNVSLRSSILNIKSVNDKREINLSASSTTINSSTSSLHIGVTPDRFETHEDHASKHNVSTTSKENNLGSLSELLIQDNSTSDIEEINSSLSINLDSDLISSFNDEKVGDLIDFRSNDSISTLSDFTPYAENLLDPKVFKNDANLSKNFQMSSNENIDKIKILFEKNSNLESINHEKNQTESTESNKIICHNSANSFDHNGTDNTKILISDYEKFLNSISFTDDISKSKVNMEFSGGGSLGVVTQSLESLKTFYEESSESENGNKISVITKYPLETEMEKADQTIDENHFSHEIDTLISELNYDSESTVNTDIMENNKMITVECDNVNIEKDKSHSDVKRVIEDDYIIENSNLFTTSSDYSICINENIKHNPLVASNIHPSHNESYTTVKSFQPSRKCESDVSKTSCFIENRIPPSKNRSTVDSNIESENLATKKSENILSSTMRTEKVNLIPSPNVSSIYSDSTLQLKRKIMTDYFQNNKAYLQMVLSNTNSSELTMKPLESSEEGTPRILDSGKASSRLTAEYSGQSTSRMTNDDIFITPRNDSYWTEYTPRDELSESNDVFRPLSEYLSSMDSYRENNKEPIESHQQYVDLNGETPKRFETISDLIIFDSNYDLSKSIPLSVTDQAPLECDENGLLIKTNNQNATPSSQKLSTLSNIISVPGSSLLDEDLSLDSPSTDCTLSMKPLDSFHSSTDSNLGALSAKEIQEFETDTTKFLDIVDDPDIDSRSQLDTSNLSLMSFLNNEFNCQEQEKKEVIKKTEVSKSMIDSNEQMKIQLEKWKKDRLLRINKDPPKDDKKQHIIKDSSMRSKEDTDMKRRTMKLWNNLEEVQKMNQQKNSEKVKVDNQLRKKQYAEKLRRLKIDKQAQKSRKTEK